MMETQNTETLPALLVQVEGRVISTNLADFTARGREMIAQINTDPRTDEELAVAAKVVTRCEESEALIDTVTAQALSQMASVDDLIKTMAALKEEFRQTRLGLKKKVEANKIAIKAQIVDEGREALERYVETINKTLGGNLVPLTDPGRFVAAIKGLSSFASIRERVASTLAGAKVDHDLVAERVATNRFAMADCAHLFPDFARVCTKETDDFAALVCQRKTEDEQRIKAIEEKARQDEADRITREAARVDAQTKAQAAQAERDALAKTAAPTASGIVIPPIETVFANPSTAGTTVREAVEPAAPTQHDIDSRVRREIGFLADALIAVRALVNPDGEARKIIDAALDKVGM